MPARFLAPAAERPDTLVPLPDDEAAHLTRVLRLGEGAEVRVFNGRGAEFDARVEQAGKAGVVVRIGARRAAAGEARIAVTLVQAVLKGDKMDDVVRDAVMMGVAAIQPVVTARTEIAVAALDRGRRRDRWMRVAVASAKQCGRAVVPDVREPRMLDAVLRGGDPALPALRLMLVEPGAAGAAPPPALGELAPADVALFVGPEGGWTPEEISLAAAHGRLLTLGPRTLRADAAATVAIASLFAVWGAY